MHFLKLFKQRGVKLVDGFYKVSLRCKALVYCVLDLQPCLLDEHDNVKDILSDFIDYLTLGAVTWLCAAWWSLINGIKISNKNIAKQLSHSHIIWFNNASHLILFYKLFVQILGFYSWVRLEHSAVCITVFRFFVYCFKDLCVNILAQLFNSIFKLHDDVSLMFFFDLEKVNAH